jgi:zinc transporter ZupT
MEYFLTFIAVVAGYALALFLKPAQPYQLKLLLAFSGAFLLSLTVLHLLPELFHDEHHHSQGHVHGEASGELPLGVFIMLGILFQIVLEFFSKGAEHGHTHGNQKLTQGKMPWLLFLSLSIHALLEGFPIYNNPHLAFGIAIHHFPIAIILSLFFIKSGINKYTLLFFMLGFALMTPLGTFLSAKALAAQQYSSQITAIVIGILFHISSTIIFETTENHKFNLSKLVAITTGFGLAYLLEIFHIH